MQAVVPLLSTGVKSDEFPCLETALLAAET